MRGFMLNFVKGRTKKGATKKKIFSIPTLNTDNKSTRSKGRSSKLKDTVGNAYAGEQEKAIPTLNTDNKSTRSKGRSSKLKDTVGNAYAGEQEKAMVLNVFDAVIGRGSLTEEQVVDMATKIGASTPFSMANADGGILEGAKHANKSAGPTKWLQDYSFDAVADELFYTTCAHGVDLLVSIHQGVRQRDLEGGAQGNINYFVSELDSKWRMKVDLFLTVSGGGALSFDPTSTDPIPPSQYQSWLRAARDRIAAHLAMDILDEKRWTGDCTPKGVVAFYSVEGEAALKAPPVAADPAVSSGGGVPGGPATSPEVPVQIDSVESSTVRSGGDGTEEGGVPTLAEEDPLLHYRRGAGRSVQRIFLWRLTLVSALLAGLAAGIFPCLVSSRAGIEGAWHVF
ncbi:unnamed protein product [Ectocarpus sp. CCAP 1310/34]|nr:unnamed protein product [Ectocarpus sp. CCAP 1310/34]